MLRLFTAGLVLLPLGCRVTFDDSQMPFRCTEEGDCGGGGYRCVNGKYCCKTDGTEAEHGCDGLDNDCNGLVDDGAGTRETCNGLDDDCDGKIDNGFDLIQDPANCGMCNHACQSTEMCSNAVCVYRGETNCTDGVDNDHDGFTDCADSDCLGSSCGVGCACRSGAKAETSCSDGVDNDGDTKIDCADPDCDGVACGTAGCRCRNLLKREIDCTNGVDDDADGVTDCLDPDCAGALCHAAPSTLTCGGGSCNCNDGGVVTETGTLCRDRKDNDCNGATDCAEAACNAVSCATDGGPGCVCTGGVAKETICNDRRDNDNDGQTDCADALPDGGGDCPIATMCTFLNASGQVKMGTCKADHSCTP